MPGEAIDERLVYDERGLVPCVVQDWNSGEVLMLAYMNETALARTRETGELHLYSRSREERGTRVRRAATCRSSGRCAPIATATPCSRSSSRPALPVTRASARAFTAAS